MDLYDKELHAKTLNKMRAECIQDFSDAELERVFADFDLPVKQGLEIVEMLIARGLTIDDLYAPSESKEEY